MTTHRIDSNETFATEVSVRRSDKYSDAVYVKFERHYVPEEIRGCNDMFLSPSELKELGLFFVEQAEKLR